jgi:hypothetical protein
MSSKSQQLLGKKTGSASWQAKEKTFQKPGGFIREEAN